MFKLEVSILIFVLVGLLTACVSGPMGTPPRTPTTTPTAIARATPTPLLQSAVGQVSITTDRASYVAERDDVVITVTNNASQPVYLPICGPWHLYRKVQEGWEVAWEILCEIDYLGHKIEPGQAFSDTFSLRDHYWIAEPGLYKIEVEVYSDCILGAPEVISPWETYYGEFEDCATREVVSCTFNVLAPATARDIIGRAKMTIENGDDYSGGEFMVPMRDGVRLWMRVILPDNIPEEGRPAVLMRTPYHFLGDDEMFERFGKLFSERGYAFVYQYCRGRFESEGTFTPYLHEVSDGQDTVAWIVAQPWSDGTVGTIGCSYDGFTALAAAVNSTNVKVVVVDGLPVDETFNTDGGLFRFSLVEWLFLLENGDWPEDDALTQATNSLDIPGLDKLFLGREDPFWRDFVDHFSPTDPWWDDYSIRDDFADICAPTLIIHNMTEMWYDPLEIFLGLKGQGCEEFRDEVRYVLAPVEHCEILGDLAYGVTGPIQNLMLNYFDVYLRGAEIDLSGVPPVQYAGYGDEEYRRAEKWPPDSTDVILYLHNDSGDLENGTLTGEPPGAEDPDEFIIDPRVEEPCQGTWTQVFYTSEPLDEDVYMVGIPELVLHVAVSAPDADILAFLMEYDGTSPPEDSFAYEARGVRGRYRNGLDDPSPLTPNEPFEVAIPFYPMANRFEAGNRIGLVIAASMCGLSENPHTGEPI